MRDIRNLILDCDENLRDAYNYLIDFDHFYRHTNHDKAEVILNSLIEKAGASEIYKLIEFGKTIIRWKSEIINAFIIVVEKEVTKVKMIDDVKTEVTEVIIRKINNGIAENKNRNLKILKNNSNGYRNWNRFRNRALYVLNQDATYHLNPIKLKKAVPAVNLNEMR